MPDAAANSDAVRGRLPTPGCLFAIAILLAAVSYCFSVGWRMYRQQVRLQYFTQLGARFETQPAGPAWMHDLITNVFDEERAQWHSDVTRVDLGSTAVTDDGLRHLRGLRHTQHVSLYNTQITDAGLQHLGGLEHLEGLSLNDTNVSALGLRHLRGLTQLQNLYLRNTEVTDAGLAHLSDLDNLQRISLDRTHVTDNGLRHLMGLENLQYVSLHHTEVTDVGEEELRTRLPDVIVLR